MSIVGGIGRARPQLHAARATHKAGDVEEALARAYHVVAARQLETARVALAARSRSPKLGHNGGGVLLLQLVSMIAAQDAPVEPEAASTRVVQRSLTRATSQARLVPVEADRVVATRRGSVAYVQVEVVEVVDELRAAGTCWRRLWL